MRVGILPTGSTLAASPSQPGAVAIENLGVPATGLTLGKRAIITANLKAGSADVGAYHVYYYDGDPKDGGKIFDITRVQLIGAGQSVPDRAIFHPAVNTRSSRWPPRTRRPPPARRPMST